MEAGGGDPVNVAQAMGGLWSGAKIHVFYPLIKSRIRWMDLRSTMIKFDTTFSNKANVLPHTMRYHKELSMIHFLAEWQSLLISH